MGDTRFIAKTYIDAGWSVVPLVPGAKRAASAWQKKTYAPSDFGQSDGIAGKCGEPSGHRVDVDCDAPEAVLAAALLLPPTGLIHGRPGKPSSHYWYTCEGIKTTQYTDVPNAAGEKTMLIEVRSTGGYTVLPPSGHPSGDILEWVTERAPDTITPDALTTAVRYVALAALLARHWPGGGARHHMVGHLAGFLLHAKIKDFLVVEIIRIAATLAKDPDVHDRVTFAQGTVGTFAAGGPVTGGPKLAEVLGEPVVAKMRSWLHLADTDAIEEMNRKHFVVRVGSDEVIGLEAAEGVVFQTSASLSLRYRNRQVPTGINKKGETTFKTLDDAWLTSPMRRAYGRVVFAPPPRPVHPDDYNLWKGFALEPAPGDCSLYLEHLHQVICSDNTEHFNYLLNLLALTIQEPGSPSEVATVLRGKQGTGKGVFIRALGDIFGPRHYTQLDKVEQLTGRFNASCSGKVVIFADEAFFAGDKREIGALKRLITEPTLHIERKGIDGVDEDNHVHLFMATNEDWSWPAGLDDRRGFLLKVSDSRRQDFKYFSALTAQMKGGGTAALLALLLEHTVDRERLRHVPRTDELRNQQTRSMTQEQTWWHNCLDTGRIGMLGWAANTWVPGISLYAVYEEWLTKRRGRLMSPMLFGRSMGKYFSAEKSLARKIAGDVVRCHKLRELDDARAFFDAELGSQGDWLDLLGTASDPF